jgi:CelD/BcsL family acetyltransferase involved in cellulose biosynthesis
VWKRLKSSLRWAIRKARRLGLGTRRGHDQLDEFYEVLAENMHRKGAPVQGRMMMREVLRVFGDAADVVTVRDGNGAVVGGAMCLVHRDVISVPFASSRQECFRMRPNDLLYWEMIEHACHRGMRRFDFGSSMLGTTTLDYKLNWGVETTPITSLVFAPGDSRPAITPDGAFARAAVALWRSMPRTLADALGPTVARAIL